MGQICLDLTGDVAQIGHRVHDLHRLRERIVTNFVRPLNVLRHPASKVQNPLDHFTKVWKFVR